MVSEEAAGGLVREKGWLRQMAAEKEKENGYEKD
jgi:hypothetical protein|nr:MAG TPA: hypothetical protein [Caudoviricetes sp.]DAK78250.1 MAG TPA: hypothetical protein [Caudoviricetes sp.]